MIATLQGILCSKSPTEIVIDVQGVGYGLNISLATYEKLGEVKSVVRLLTYLHVREDALQLYGFATEDEREMFRLLISINGIGPKMAQGILSGISVADLRNYIAAGNYGALTTIPGVGRKIAERLVVELREKITRLDAGAEVLTGLGDTQARVRVEALAALTALGYSRPLAEKALRAALQAGDGAGSSVEGLLKSALRHAAKP